ncbi:MAG: lysophospholipid acyltransferase family protein [Planctomycetaceae bacterium]
MNGKRRPPQRGIKSLAVDIRQRLVCFTARAAICVVQSLPRSFCERTAKRLARFLAHRVHLRRRVVRENLRRAFPDWNAGQCRQVSEQMWEHLLLMVVEIAHAERVIRVTTWRRHMRIDGMEQMLRLLWADRPKVILSGHFGNFELAAFLFGVFGLKIYSVARTLDNPYLDRFVTRFRQSRGQTILPKRGSAPDVSEVLERNGALGLLGDQSAGAKGCWVEFFGRPASVHKAIPIFALSSRSPVMVCSATRRGGLFDFDMRLEGIADPDAGDAATTDLMSLAQWYTHVLERSIRRAPGQYWWVHNRWRPRHNKPRARRRVA